MTIRVMLADDHLLVRAGIRALLASLPDVEVVGEAAGGEEALVAVQEFEPDVALLDISMQGMNGLEAARRVLELRPATRVVMLSMHASEDYVARALHAGASGYLMKGSAAQELERALQAVMRGERYLDSHISAEALQRHLDRVGTDGTPEILTARQREVLQLIAESLGTKEIAYRLGVSAKTVETHRRELMQRLNIHDVPGLVRYAIRNGIASVHETRR
ncbi:MAG: response regulator transcription factor [Oxalobacteraceae bacterium]|nr:MAG: response regulator transcription factor [Oxalobacteraceae bacterium]